MSGDPPTLIAIDHDDYHAEHIGHTADGRQFFLTTPFVPIVDEDDCQEFVALYLFAADGALLEARIDVLGRRSELDLDAARAAYQRRLAELGEVRFDRIEVAPFAVDRFGTTFGLIVRAPEDEDGLWWVELEPGNCMAFTEPWDRGDYDT